MGSAAQPASVPVLWSTRVALATVGFVAVTAQIVVMRELFVFAQGNELSIGICLAVWLLWTAAGSAFFDRPFVSRSSKAVLATLLTATPLLLVASIVFIRWSRAYWRALPGEALGPAPIILTALLALAFFCPFSGWLFTAGTRYFAEVTGQSSSSAGASMYLFDAAGSATGGVLASLVLVPHLNAMQIASLVLGVSLLAASAIAIRNRAGRHCLFALIVVAVGMGAWGAGSLESHLLRPSWPGFAVLATTTSPYGSLAVVESAGSRSLTQNGSSIFAANDQSSAEEAVHFAMLEHPAPRSVLLIGGGLNGSLNEILKYKSVEQIHYVELDPAVLDLGQQFFPDVWSALARDTRLRVYPIDGHRFLNSTPSRYDVIILNLPEPQTAQINRFYTVEFFGTARAHLNAGGVFAFQTHASEEYLSPQLAEFLRCLRSSLSESFPEVIAIPGENIHFMASPQPGTLTSDPVILVQRLQQRAVSTQYVREYYLPFRMSPERIADLDAQLSPFAGKTRLNRDFAPIAYFFDVELWSAQYSSSYRALFRIFDALPFRNLLIAIATLAVGLAVFGYLLGRSHMSFAAGYATTLMGLTIMAAEVLLLLGFQTVFGYVYSELALIIGAFMAGIAFGSWIALRSFDRSNRGKLLLHALSLQLAAIFLLLVLTPALEASGRSGLVGFTIHATVIIFAVALGALAGLQFPIATRLFIGDRKQVSSVGTLYALDLVGACLGAILVSTFLIPLFGFRNTAALVAVANLGPVLLLPFCVRDA